MAADRPFGIDFTTGKEIVIAPLVTPSGGDDSGRLIALESGTNKINPAFVPDVSAPTRTVTAIEEVAARRLIYLISSSGQKGGLAVNTDETKACVAYSEAGAASGAPLVVQYGGECEFDIGSTGIVATDYNKPVYLGATAGIPSKVPASTTGYLYQRVGYISNVDTGNSKFWITLNPEPARTIG